MKEVTFYNSAGQKVAFSNSKATALSYSPAVGPQLANDAKDTTAWRPKITTAHPGCNAGEAAYQVRWSTSQTIVAATAVGLGVGNGGGNTSATNEMKLRGNCSRGRPAVAVW